MGWFKIKKDGHSVSIYVIICYKYAVTIELQKI